MKKFFLIIVLVIGLLGAGLGFLLFYPKDIPHDYHINIKSGQGMVALSQDLKKDHIIYSQKMLLIGAYYLGIENQLIQGSYTIQSPASTWDILLKLQMAQPDHNLILIRIPEGQTITQIRKQIQNNKALRNNTAKLSDTDLLKRIDPKSKETSLEGLLFPDSYSVADNTDSLTVYRLAYQTAQKHLKQIWDQRAKDLPYHSPYELLTMASIIEKETGRDDDRDKISAVFVNRVRKNMRLQTDPTIIYGMGEDYHGNIRKVDLQRDTPYNTYLHEGLPPTPISSTSLASLMAAAHPADVPYLYFVSKNDGSGKSCFNANFRSHNLAVRAYILRRPVTPICLNNP